MCPLWRSDRDPSVDFLYVTTMVGQHSRRSSGCRLLVRLHHPNQPLDLLVGGIELGAHPSGLGLLDDPPGHGVSKVKSTQLFFPLSLTV